MLKHLILFVLFLSACAKPSAPVATVQLALPRAEPQGLVQISWDASPSEEVTGYRLYMGFGGENFNQSFDTTGLTYTVSGLEPLTQYEFAVTAFDVTGDESDFSDHVYYISSALLAIDIQWGLALTGVTGWTYELQSTDDLRGEWTDVASIKFDNTGKAIYPVDFTKPQMFFRLKRTATQ